MTTAIKLVPVLLSFSPNSLERAPAHVISSESSNNGEQHAVSQDTNAPHLNFLNRKAVIALNGRSTKVRRPGPIGLYRRAEVVEVEQPRKLFGLALVEVQAPYDWAE